MRWIYSDKRDVGYMAKLACHLVTGKATFIAEMDGDMPKAIVLFDHNVVSSVNVHSWIYPGFRTSRAFWFAVHDYLFRQLKVLNVIGTVPSSNMAARKLDEHLGFKLIATIPNYYEDGDDQLIYLAREEDATFWQPYRDGKRQPPVFSQDKLKAA